MKYLLDTANLDAIRYYTDIFPIAGVTSNPSIVKKEGKIDLLSHIYSREILFTSICWFRKEEADSTNFSSASVV